MSTSFASNDTLKVLESLLPGEIDNKTSWWQNYREEREEYLEKLKVRVVGLQHYTGKFHSGEWVLLVREPRNMYDRNAIRVNNISGVQIGHINRNAAAVLAPLMDDTSLAKIRFEGSIPVAGDTKYVIHIELAMFGLSQVKSDLLQYLEKHLQKVGQNELVMPKMKRTTGDSTKTVRLQKQQTQEELDKLFTELDLKNVEIEKESQELIIPNLLTELLPHQKFGVSWMKRREDGANNKTELPPFWKMEGKKYFNEISLTTHDSLPTPVLGGLLLDDMGLGKSIQMLSLCLLRPRPKEEDEDDKKRSGGTLIICPASVITAWDSQIAEHVKANTWKVHLHCGANRSETSLWKPDIVITTFDILAREVNSTTKKNSGLQNIQWHRVIVDEGHVIRNRNTNRFRALLELSATHRWALTGTPLVNSQDDIFALMAFLRLSPLKEYTVWSRAISKPIKAGDIEGLTRLRIAVKGISLRRDKSVLSLPPKKIEIHSLEFLSKEHQNCYETLYDAAIRVLRGFNSETLLGNYVFILEIILRLRQACCDPTMISLERMEAARQILKNVTNEGKELSMDEAKKLLLKLKSALNNNDEEEEDEGEGKKEDEDTVAECAICMDTIDNESARILKACSHVFCVTCIERIQAKDPRCPFCRTAFSTIFRLDELKVEEEEEVPRNETTTTKRSKTEKQQIVLSSKVKGVLDYLDSIPKDEKCVIFSNFTHFLNIVQESLKDKYKSVRIDGSVSVSARKDRIKTFQTDETVRVFLISMKAGGVGLTLTRANHVIILDPWWNFSSESQAFERVHRIGQVRPCTVIRFIMKGTIEERILDLQEKKQLLSTGALSQLSDEEIRKMRAQDLKTLLDM